MKWSFIIEQKLKAAGLLFGIMVVTVLTSLSMKHAIQDMDQTVTSVYVDRLQPAIDIVYLSENLYIKRLLLDDFLSGRTGLTATDVRQKISQYDAQSQKMVDEFRKTKLAEGEGVQLDGFQKRMADYAQLEHRVLRLHESGQAAAAVQLLYGEGSVIFGRGIRNLHELAHIQAATGREAVDQVHRQAAGGSINAMLLVALALIVGFVIQALIYNSKLVNRPVQNIHLN
ncbi:hypothetical protein F5984_04220 [Rudanella paleaurantiibacter]|uniref:Chemotaxis methyl-accepting receptor HlyB-like 4HB MCP domain-containing protein n=1 Tax=Rudanella paleaurantiibacter TaxID=2614655 RepID=A0A7J5U7K7_9BACT|nr:MCP four helix bundle domain-containing protein [Rudanella paleaurantiibacter]KAB7733150.1 hypothetical protein F5984_04220 [Rudanella paleaurantiibacter]